MKLQTTGKIIILGIVVIAGFYFFSVNSANTKRMPSEFRNDNEAFKESVLALAEARDLTQPPEEIGNELFDLSDETVGKIESLNREGLSLSGQVSDDYLDSLDSELKIMYREKLIKGTELWFEGYNEHKATSSQDSVIKQLEGNKLIMEWIDWFEGKKGEIGDKIF